MPPPEPATYTVLPDGSEGSRTTLLTRPAPALVLALFGPSGVHWLADWEFALSIVKMRNATDVWSATSSPRPETLIGLTNVSFQLSSCPLLILLELVISSVQSPLTFFCASAASGSCGLN